MEISELAQNDPELAHQKSAPIHLALVETRIGANPLLGAELAQIEFGFNQGQGAAPNSCNGASKKKDKIFPLRERLNRLLQQEASAAAAVRAAEIEGAPFKAAFQRADETLRALHRGRKGGRPVAGETMRGAYDARVLAGFSWNKPRQTLKDAVAWHKRVREEIRNINVELG